MANKIPSVRPGVTAARRPAAPVAGRPNNQADTFKPKDFTGWDMQQAHKWRGQLENEINRRKNLGQDISNWQRHYQDVTGYIKGLRNPAAPTPEPTPEPQPEATPQPEAPAPAPAPDPSVGAAAPGYDWNNYQSPMTKALMEAFQGNMKGLSQFGNSFFENSPQYVQARQQGQQALDRRLAAQGLTGSGAQIEGQNDFMAKLMAEESEKQRRWAGDMADRAQQGMQFISNYDQSERETLRDQANRNKDRETELSMFDATRNDGWRNQQLGTLMQILGLQAQTSPMNDIYKAIGDQNQVTKAIGDTLAKYQANNYVRRSGGGGGGGGATPPPPPPADDTNLRIMEAIMGRNNAGGNVSVGNTILNGILGLFGGGK